MALPVCWGDGSSVETWSMRVHHLVPYGLWEARALDNLSLPYASAWVRSFPIRVFLPYGKGGLCLPTYLCLQCYQEHILSKNANAYPFFFSFLEEESLILSVCKVSQAFMAAINTEASIIECRVTLTEWAINHMCLIGHACIDVNFTSQKQSGCINTNSGK